MAKIYILCGKIASGKTTYAKELKKTMKAVILSHDDLMLKLYDGCLGSNHDEAVRRISDYFYNLAEELIALDTNVIFDFGYWTKSERLYAKEYFSDKGIDIEVHYLKTSDSQRFKWLDHRNRSLAEATSRVYIIENNLRETLDKKFEDPTEDEVHKIITH